MPDYSKVFNLNKSTFLFAGSARGQYLNEISETEFKKVVSARLVGFKIKDFTGLVGFMPGLKELTIEKNSKLTSLEGVQQWNLEKLVLEGCTGLDNYSAVADLKTLKEFSSNSVPSGTEVLKYVGNKIKDLVIDPNAADIQLLSDMASLQHLSLVCDKCGCTTLPLLPKSLKSLRIEGDFDNLKDASFMSNLTPKINLILWINTKGMKNVPTAFKNHPDFS